MSRFSFIPALLLFFVAVPAFGQTTLLSPEESLWLKSRNNTIVVYPEKNNPPFSYTSAGGSIQGLAIDYLELIAEKIDAKIVYLLPQSRSQILNDFAAGKGDVVAGLMETNDGGVNFIFTDSFITVPTVIVVRKDFEKRTSLTLNDFNGQRVSVISGSALEGYVQKNYPRVVIEDVTDDEISLQQVVLGEVDAAVMDIASLSYYLSKQVLSSVKIVGNTGLDYKPAFALLKDKTILQSILEKGMTQISTNDRSLLTDKWVVVPNAEPADDSLLAGIKGNYNTITFLVLFILILLVAVASLFRRKSFGMHYFQKTETISELKKEVAELEGANDMLTEEMKVVKAEEDKIQEKLESLGK
ncbi:MAG: transporter substrate-binding domain-containing protein [Patescibacteria group bacterium]